MGSVDQTGRLTDEELLARFRGGDRGAFGELVRRYERDLFAYLRRYLNDDSLADDVFQNTFVQLYVKGDQYEPGRPVRPWLFKIAHNQAIDALRRAGRQSAVSLDRQAGETPDGEVSALIDLIEAQGDGPPERAAAGEDKVRVRDWVARLPDFLKQVVILAYYEGWKYREIADMLDIPVGTVKSRLHTALVRLHEIGSASADADAPQGGGDDD